MMYLQKEREEFEKERSSKGREMINWFKWFVHNSIVHPIMPFLPKKIAIKLHDKNGEWAFSNKQTTVPEGFVVVSHKDLLELAIAINAVDLATHTEEKPNEVREMWQQVALKLGALCSTGASQ